jgi:hypothetical protein
MEKEIRDAIYQDNISKLKEIQAEGYDMNKLSVSDIKTHF